MLQRSKKDKYKIIFGCAKEFLDEIIAYSPELNQSILKEHLKHESKFDNIKDVNKRLIESLANRNTMASVINFKKRKSSYAMSLL